MSEGWTDLPDIRQLISDNVLKEMYAADNYTLPDVTASSNIFIKGPKYKVDFGRKDYKAVDTTERDKRLELTLALTNMGLFTNNVLSDIYIDDDLYAQIIDDDLYAQMEKYDEAYAFGNKYLETYLADLQPVNMGLNNNQQLKVARFGDRYGASVQSNTAANKIANNDKWQNKSAWTSKDLYARQLNLETYSLEIRTIFEAVRQILEQLGFNITELCDMDFIANLGSPITENGTRQTFSITILEPVKLTTILERSLVGVDLHWRVFDIRPAYETPSNILSKLDALRGKEIDLFNTFTAYKPTDITIPNKRTVTI